MFIGATGCGGIQNIMLMAPNRSGTFLGISNGFGNLAGLKKIKKLFTEPVKNNIILPIRGQYTD